jgi:hypothetical protein
VNRRPLYRVHFRRWGAGETEFVETASMSGAELARVVPREADLLRIERLRVKQRSTGRARVGQSTRPD